jgi:hypothetical protein
MTSSRHSLSRSRAFLQRFGPAKLPLALSLLAVSLLACPAACSENLRVPPEIRRGLDLIFNGNPDAAIPLARKLEDEHPDHPLGYLLELEARWWKTYCEACEVKWGMVDAWKRGKRKEDQEFLALADKSEKLASAQMSTSDSAEMHLYAGMAYAFKARLYALRDEHHAVARSGVAARAEFLRTLEIDPGMVDADTGLGLYNYYVDTLSGLVKVLRFFIGIPGGSKKDGIHQLETAMNEGELTKWDARFYLAKNLRLYDHLYEQAEEVLIPAVEHYPENPLFHLMVANLNVELGHNDRAAAEFEAANATAGGDSECARNVRVITQDFVSTLH